MRRTRTGLCTATVLLAALLVLPNVIYEPCFGDQGELQLCSAVAGIAHPAGHAGLCLLGWVLTRLPGADPAAVIAMANVIAALLCLGVLMWAMLQSGASGVAALVAITTWACSPPVWRALTAPEVYAPCLALLAIAVLLLRAGANRRGRAWSAAAAFVLGFAVATRPPLAFYLPGFVLLGWWSNPAGGRRSRLGGAMTAGTAFIAGIAVCVAYLWLRDTPENPYNYIARHPAMEQSYERPEGSADRLHSRARRIWWLISAEQFSANLRPTPRTVAAQARWLWTQLDGQYPVIFGAYAVVVLTGAVAFTRRSRRGGAVLALWAAGAVCSLLVIQQVGDAAMMLPLLCALAFCGAHGLSALLTVQPNVPIAVALITLHVVCRWWTADERYLTRPADVAAGEFLREHRPADVPPDAVLLARWREAAPLLYELRVAHNRPDVAVIDVTYRDWRDVLRRAGDRPVLAPPCAQPPPDLIAEREGPWLRLRLTAEEQ